MRNDGASVADVLPAAAQHLVQRHQVLLLRGLHDDGRLLRGQQRALRIARTPDSIAPLVFTVPLQLLAYHVAVLRGTDVDQPRNLAKSVTVE